MFYDKRVEIWSKGLGEDIGGGVIISGKPVLKYRDKVDIQPYSSAEAKKDYGFDVETTNAMFSRVNDLNIGKDLVKYNGDNYEIIEKVLWEDYMETLLKRV